MGSDARGFRGRVGEALADRRLGAAIEKGSGLLAAGRARAVAADPGFEELRRWARERKLEVSGDLWLHAEAFASRVQALGAKVWWARDAAGVADAVMRIVRSRDLRRAVKSMSMTSEEVGLNRILAGLGVQVTETDLGEFIIQLAGEGPSHVLIPAIHRDRPQVAELLAERLGVPPATSVEGMIALARRALRARFLEADVGFTGANFAIAETGTLALVTNEGNGRMVTTLPEVHVALVGIDKVLPRLADLPRFLTLLTRSATGQPLSSYVSLVTGPRRAGEEEGPEELHVILLDGGRSRLARTPYREMLHCLHCGACLNHCPVYRAVGGHAWSSPYPGPMGSLLTSLLPGLPSDPDLPHACTLCGRCAEICPVRIPLADYHRMLREEGCTGLAAAVGALGAEVAARPLPYRATLVAARGVLLSAPSRLSGSVAGALRAWQERHELPKPEPGSSFRRWWAERERTEGSR